MKLTLVCLCAILLDRLLGKPPRWWDPRAGFVWLAQRLEEFGYGPAGLKPLWRLLLGALALLALVVPIGLAFRGLSLVPYLVIVVEIGVLYLALEVRDLEQRARAVTAALRENDLIRARAQVGHWVSRDTHAMDEEEVSLAAVEALLRQGCCAAFGPLFWFLAAGAPGVVVYRLVLILDGLWGHATPRYLHFGWFTARLNSLLNWLPARLTALSYSLVGDRETAWRCWRRQASAWRDWNTGAMLAAGAGALNLQLGGATRYYEREVLRPALGEGLLPGCRDIPRAMQLIHWSIGLWLMLVLLGEWWWG